MKAKFDSEEGIISLVTSIMRERLRKHLTKTDIFILGTLERLIPMDLLESLEELRN